MTDHPSVYDHPTQELTLIDNQRVAKQMMEKKDFKHMYNNFMLIAKHLGRGPASDIDHLSQRMYTYEKPGYIRQFTRGITPRSIQNLPKNGGYQKFYESEIDIAPKKFFIKEPIPSLTPHVQQLKIRNSRKERGAADITIHDVFTSSPELTTML